jgi:hypothetical protein
MEEAPEVQHPKGADSSHRQSSLEMIKQSSRASLSLALCIYAVHIVHLRCAHCAFTLPVTACVHSHRQCTIAV